MTLQYYRQGSLQYDASSLNLRLQLNSASIPSINYSTMNRLCSARLMFKWDFFSWLQMYYIKIQMFSNQYDLLSFYNQEEWRIQ